MGKSWRNWTGDVTCAPAVVERPRSVDEVATGILRAADSGRNVRVVGSGHSFGDTVCTDGTLMSLDELRGLHHVDKANGLVKVGAGTKLHELNQLLDAEGLAMPNLGDIDRQSVAGAMSTATHGTGRRLGNLATQVESLDLVLADGSALTVTAADAETLAAARVSVGALGVITAYTLRVVSAFNLHSHDAPLPLDEVLGSLDELVDENDHFEFFLFPHSDIALTKRNNRTEEAAAPASRIASFVTGRVVENQLLDLICRIGRQAPGQIPRLNRLVTRLVTETSQVDKSYRVFASPRDVRFTESEWALPREACAGVLQDVRSLVAKKRFDVNMPLEVRFVAADEESYLSPSYGRETAYLAVHAYQGMAWTRYFEAVQEIALANGGRPHWGKRHSLDAAQLSRLYPEWDRFQTVRTRLDPGGVFANAHTRRLFDPAREGVNR